MNPITKGLKLSKYDYYEMHLSIISPFLPSTLTAMEIRVLSRFMALEGDIAIYRFGTTARRVVKENLGLTTAGLSNYMGTLIEKKFLVKNGDLIEIIHILFPEKNEQTYMFKLVNEG
jgi:hypothetical protein